MRFTDLHYHHQVQHQIFTLELKMFLSRFQNFLKQTKKDREAGSVINVVQLIQCLQKNVYNVCLIKNVRNAAGLRKNVKMY